MECPTTSLDVLANDRDPDWVNSADDPSRPQAYKGSAAIAPDGKHILYDPGSAFQYLAAGQTGTETIQYSIADRFGKRQLRR